MDSLWPNPAAAATLPHLKNRTDFKLSFIHCRPECDDEALFGHGSRDADGKNFRDAF